MLNTRRDSGSAKDCDYQKVCMITGQIVTWFARCIPVENRTERDAGETTTSAASERRFKPSVDLGCVKDVNVDSEDPSMRTKTR